MTLLPGSRFSTGRGDGGSIWFSLYVSPWLVIIPVLLTFLLVARVWRPLTQRKG